MAFDFNFTCSCHAPYAINEIERHVQMDAFWGSYEYSF